MDMSVSKLWEMVKDREAWCVASMGLGMTEWLNSIIFIVYITFMVYTYILHIYVILILWFEIHTHTHTHIYIYREREREKYWLIMNNWLIQLWRLLLVSWRHAGLGMMEKWYCDFRPKTGRFETHEVDISTWRKEWNWCPSSRQANRKNSFLLGAESASSSSQALNRLDGAHPL